MEILRRKGSEFIRFVLADLNGKSYEVAPENFVQCAIFRQDAPHYQLLRQFVTNELQSGNGDKGIPKGHTVLICGGPGSGKTTFAIQFLYKGIIEYNEPGLYITLDEDPMDIRKNMSKFMKAGAFLIRKTSSLNRVITDHNLNPKIVDIFNKLDTKLII